MYWSWKQERKKLAAFPSLQKPVIIIIALCGYIVMVIYAHHITEIFSSSGQNSIQLKSVHNGENTTWPLHGSLPYITSYISLLEDALIFLEIPDWHI